MRKILSFLSDSVIMQAVVALSFYALYAAVLGLSLFPSFRFLIWLGTALFPAGVFVPGAVFPIGASLLFCLGLGASLFIFAASGVLVMGISIRLLSIGIRPGEYPAVSLTVLRWLLYSGISTMAHALILPLIPMSFFANVYFRLLGCRMGKRVRLNSLHLNDAFLIELGDDVTVGGKADICAHLFQNGKLILGKILIGSGSLIGSKAYIAPGVTIGKRCLIGLGAYIRPGTIIPDGMNYASLGGLPLRRILWIERGEKTNRTERGPSR
jgi:hypothetical protein